ncbi:serine/threonine protein kinase [Sorangium cellulosum]|uniref:Serine/threonine protein kinase n=1 Tax=Sorangium cellulosum TaxID=56 RepID=A0A4P2QCE7_SORCE|nr:AAA family ATPase [Sorangium cellulosum]AUX27424.1 serine/threonine protein kinase [Sorangium cellulosum]
MRFVSGADPSRPLPGYSSAVLIDEGHETAVYRAVRDADGEPVILKLTRSDYPTSRELARLRREFGILRALDVPRVPRAYALHEHDRGLALVMADVGRPMLRDVLDSRRLDVGAALAIAVSLAEVLSSVHQRRIIHKDVVPRNILVDPATREAYLIDFGIAARLSYETQRVAGPDALEGTLAYLAPEQTGRMSRVIDLRADLYSMGVVLYEMLTGALPFPSENATELIHSHIASVPVAPHARAPEVPLPLSNVVMTLLAKTPEERYQSAEGLRADLVECARQWESARSIAPFPLRRHDRVTELRQAQRLHGRERDVARLLEAFERARARGPELVLVSGYSGVGKSALIHEIHKPIARKGGYFVSGKFDQMSRDVPLAPVAHALRELTRQILTEPSESLEAWKKELGAALGNNARVLVDLVPELELVLGPQPEVAALGPVETKNRFDFTVQSFIGVVATADHPLVLFLDDLQWIDPASLKLVQMLLRDARSEHLLLIGAYRDNEVELGHPLSALLEELQRAGFRSTDIRLGPLDGPRVAELVADTLTTGVEEVEALAALVFEKTQGNPFFVHQFLDALYRDGLLHVEAGAWRWDLDRIRGARVTDNVADLMIGKLQRLAPETRRMLTLASCIGFKFGLRTLATISERSLRDAARDLWGALLAGLVVPIDSDYRLLEADLGDDGGLPDAIPVDFDVNYRFLHDRVLQAAYQLVEDAHKQQVHLSVGRLLRQHAGEPPRDDELLDIVHHLNRGAPGMSDPAERADLAALNLRAGRKARASTAYHAAAAFFAAGAALLCEESWESRHELAWALHAEGAECAYLSGDIERAEAIFDALLPRARGAVERAGLYLLRTRMLNSLARHSEALKAGNEGLTALGLGLPLDGDIGALFLEEERQIKAALGDRRVEDLIHAAEARDPVIRAAEQLHAAMLLPAFFAHQSAFGLLTVRRVKLVLEHGPTCDSASAYSSYGSLLAGAMGRVAEGMAFGKLAMALNERLPNPGLTALVKVTYGTYAYLREPMRDVTPYYHAACQAGLEAGDFTTLGVATFLTTQYLFAAGYQLEDVLENAEKNLALNRRTREALPIAVLTVTRQAVANLMGRTLSRSTLSDGHFNEEEFLATLDEKEHGNTLFHLHVMMLRQRCFYGDYAGALAAAEAADQKAAYASGDTHTTELAFYWCVTLLGLPPAEAPEEAARRAELLRRNKERVEDLAAGSPRSFEHKRVLVEAEEARVAGDVKRAIALYEQAMTLAREDRFPQIEALASELCASFYVGLGATAAAGAYLSRAHRAYLHWGALAKADAIEQDHPELLPAQVDEGRRLTTSVSTSTGSLNRTLFARASIGSIRDAALVVRAAQAISSEMDLNRVVERLMTIVLENSGAQRGALILSREGTLVVEATFQTDPNEVKVDQEIPVEEYADLARSVVVYVARTKDPAVLHDTSEANRFSEDPYLGGGATRSLLCLPLLHQGRLSGVLYLENGALRGVFTAARVELLALLSSQAAIAIESARLFAGIRRAKEEVQHANERLEAEVAQRTEQLRRANAELSGANAKLERELVQRELVERERAALQEQVLLSTRMRLAELSTPLLPITDQIMVMPLIGTVDEERASQVMEVALEGAQRHAARVVILDVTGLKQIDSHAAGALCRVAMALRLLGTEAVLSGVAPQVAQTLVGLGIDLSSIATKGTLQSGMAYALQRVRAGGGHVGVDPR